MDCEKLLIKNYLLFFIVISILVKYFGPYALFTNIGNLLLLFDVYVDSVGILGTSFFATITFLTYIMKNKKYLTLTKKKNVFFWVKMGLILSV